LNAHGCFDRRAGFEIRNSRFEVDMKAIRVHQFGGPEVLQLQDLPDPVASTGQVVVATIAIGVNPVETYIRAGKYGPRSFPFTPGSDAAGVVEQVGAGVSGFKPGDRVYVYGSLTGTYAQKILCAAEQVHPLPDRLSFEQGAAIGIPFGTAYRALFVRGRAVPLEWVLIHGASGGVGTAAVQLAAQHGCRVLGTSGTPDGRALVKRLGALEAFDHHHNGYEQHILDETQGHGVDLIVEMLADKNLDRDLGLLAKSGRVVIVGNRGRTEIDARQTMGKDSDIRGMSLMHADGPELARIHAHLATGFASGTLVPVIGARFELAQAALAHDAILKPGATGKIILKV
jgi:NADPH2:quinone reductase